MKRPNEEMKKLFLVCTVIADRTRKELLITKETVENLHNLTYHSTITYFKYKNRYPDYEEIVIPDFKKMPLGIEI